MFFVHRFRLASGQLTVAACGIDKTKPPPPTHELLHDRFLKFLTTGGKAAETDRAGACVYQWAARASNM